MTTLLFLFAILLAAGMFFILSDVLKLPTLGAARAMLGAGRGDKKAAKTMEAWLMSLAVRLSKRIPMDEYKRSRMANILKAAGIGTSPEVYAAYAMVKTGAILLGVIPCLLLFPLLSPVLQHNNHHFLDGYERTADMIADNVEPIPIKLWNWGIAHCSGALRSFPEETVKLCLMPTGTASVTAKGIRFKGLYYLCERAAVEHWFETARAKGSYKVDVSFDPRNMSAIYVREPDGSFDSCFLAEWQDKYVDMCLDEIRYLQESEKLLRRQNAAKEMATKADLSAAIDSVIAEAEEMARQTAVPKSKLARTKNIRENRRAEKERNRRDEAFSLGDDDVPQTAKPEPQEKPAAISPTLAMIQKQLEERLNEK